MRNQENWLTSSRATLLVAHETAIGALKSASPSEISTKFKAEISMVYYRAKAIGLVLGLTKQTDTSRVWGLALGLA